MFLNNISSVRLHNMPCEADLGRARGRAHHEQVLGALDVGVCRLVRKQVGRGLVFIVAL